MFNRIISTEKLKSFELYLIEEERSSATVEKYMRDVRFFMNYIGGDGITKQRVMEYKQMLGNSYAVSSANSMIAALNSFFNFCAWNDLCVKQFKIQRQAYCSEDKELTKEEYVRLLNAAHRKNNERLNLIIQTICGTGIRVSELRFITVESLHCGEAVVNCKGKNRRIFIGQELRKKLLRYVRSNKIASGTIFVTKNGNPISRNNIWREMKSLCKDAFIRRNLPNIFSEVTASGTSLSDI